MLKTFKYIKSHSSWNILNLISHCPGWGYIMVCFEKATGRWDMVSISSGLLCHPPSPPIQLNAIMFSCLKKKKSLFLNCCQPNLPVESFDTSQQLFIIAAVDEDLSVVLHGLCQDRQGPSVKLFLFMLGQLLWCHLTFGLLNSCPGNWKNNQWIYFFFSLAKDVCLPSWPVHEGSTRSISLKLQQSCRWSQNMDWKEPELSLNLSLQIFCQRQLLLPS